MATSTMERVNSGEIRHVSITSVVWDAESPISAFRRHAKELGRERRATLSSRWPLRAGLTSAKGRRPVNEDSVYANSRDGLFLVADGIGGYLGGQVASRILIDTVAPLLSPPILDRTLSIEDVQNQILIAVTTAHDAMRELARCEPSLKKMGSTMALGLVINKTLYVAHVGDSRVYLVRRNRISKITKDQTMVQSLIDAGVLTLEAAQRSAFRHVILDSVNAERPPGVEISVHELVRGDSLLLTTDGLTDFVGEEDLEWTITHVGDPQLASRILVREALARNSKDNVTCLVAHIGRARTLSAACN